MNRREPLILLALSGLVTLWSGISPKDRMVWWMEVAPVFVGAAVFAWRWKPFPFTPLALRLCFVFSLVLLVGGHYTYAEVPAGFWVRDAFGFSRNHFDRLGHFLQGVIPAILAREMLLRCTPLKRGKALFWLCVSVALAVSAMYELIEWISAITTAPEQGTAFLGTQGDEWDAQKDMLMAGLGALSVQLAFGRLHDRHLERLSATSGACPRT